MAKVLKKPDEVDEALQIVQAVNAQAAKEDKTLDDVIMLGLDQYINNQCPFISTRSISLDIALGIGGVPRGRVIEIYGPESSGKTTLAATIVAEAQSLGDLAAYIDVEHACDPSYMKKLGCNLSRLMFSQPSNGEQAMKTVEQLVKTGKLGVIVVDSVAALVPKAELDGEIGEAHIGAQARLMSQSMRKLVALTAKTKTCLIFINQIREKIGIVGFGQSNETQPGGRALKFYSSVRMDIRRIGSLQTSDKSRVGNETRVKVVKNKVAPPFKEANFTIMFGEGISRSLDTIDAGVKYGIIEKSGSSLGYNGVRLGMGRIQAYEFLNENPIVLKEIKDKIMETYRNKNIVVPVTDDPIDIDIKEEIEVNSENG